MSTFLSSKSYEASPSFVPYAVDAIRKAFVAEGFEFVEKPGTYNTTVIEVTKGNLVKKLVGLKLGLEITFWMEHDHIRVEAKGTVAKNQLIATGITLFIAWPVIVTQAIGLIKQSELDVRVISIVDGAYASFTEQKPAYCTNCGGLVTGAPSRCPHCGASL